MGKFIDLTGQQFNRLIVIKKIDRPINKNKNKNTYWLCKCVCGNDKEIILSTGEIKSGSTKSCGCLQKEKTIEFNKKTKSNNSYNKKYNVYDLSGEYGIGYTLKGEEFLFDLEDYNKIKDYCWHINKYGYLIAKTNDKYNLIHRFILNNIWDICDHINRNKLDNRKENLREASYDENSFNRNIRNNNTSGIIGVHFKSGKWCATISKNKIKYYLGCYINKKDAIVKRLEAEKEYFGEFAPQRHLYDIYLGGTYGTK